MNKESTKIGAENEFFDDGSKEGGCENRWDLYKMSRFHPALTDGKLPRNKPRATSGMRRRMEKYPRTDDFSFFWYEEGIVFLKNGAGISRKDVNKNITRSMRWDNSYKMNIMIKSGQS